MTTEAVSVRAISLELLLSILKEGEYSHLELSAALEKYHTPLTNPLSCENPFLAVSRTASLQAADGGTESIYFN